MPRKRKTPVRVLSQADLIQVADGIVDPTPVQIGIFRGFYQSKFGVVLEPDEIAARLRHLASLYALLRGHERRSAVRHVPIVGRDSRDVRDNRDSRATRRFTDAEPDTN